MSANQRALLHPRNFAEIKWDALRRAYDVLRVEEAEATRRTADDAPRGTALLLLTEAAAASALEWARTATKAGRLPPTPKGRKASCHVVA